MMRLSLRFRQRKRRQAGRAEIQVVALPRLKRRGCGRIDNRLVNSPLGVALPAAHAGACRFFTRFGALPRATFLIEVLTPAAKCFLGCSTFSTPWIRSALSSETKCSTPADLIIGTADQDLRECCHAMLFAFVG